MRNRNKSKRIRCLTECAMLVALSVVLSFIKIWQMPLGGAVTLVSMLPVCAVSVRHGMRWGFAASFIYSLCQLVLGITMDGILGWGLTPAMLIGCMLFDYIIAFTVLGLAGIFRSSGEKGVYAGMLLAFFCRFVSHVISGYVIFTNLDQWEVLGRIFSERPVLYSVCYNGFFMLPELVLTMVAVLILMRVPYIRKNVFSANTK